MEYYSAKKLLSQGIEEENKKKLDTMESLSKKKHIFSKSHIKNLSNNLFIKARKERMQNLIKHKKNINKKELELKIDGNISIKLFENNELNSSNNHDEKKFFNAFEKISKHKKAQFKEINKVNKIIDCNTKKSLLGLITDLDSSSKNIQNSPSKKKENKFPYLVFNNSDKKKSFNKIRLKENKDLSEKKIISKSVNKNLFLLNAYNTSKSIIDSMLIKQYNIKHKELDVKLDRTNIGKSSRPKIGIFDNPENKLLLNERMKKKHFSKKINYNFFLGTNTSSSRILIDNNSNK